MEGQVTSETISAQELLSQLRETAVFSQSQAADLACLDDVELVHAPAGSLLFEQGEPRLSFWVLLGGQVKVTKAGSKGEITPLAVLQAGESFGEVPLMLGSECAPASCSVVEDSTLVRIEADAFWRLMSTCPAVRGGVLANMARRIETYQTLTQQREKLISLGTLAAGLMHELNNPGAAAKRAASQLRENMTQLQEISLRLTDTPLTQEQKSCLRDLQQAAFNQQKNAALGSLEQSDAEEALTEWLESIGVMNAWKLAPILVAAGWVRDDIQCAQYAFPPALLSDALNWLGALLSNFHLLTTIEESLSRVTELVIAVKKYAWDGKNKEHQVDVQDSIHSTLILLGHKFRHKQIVVEKRFTPELPRLTTSATGLSQVWTNLLDNAIDASPDGGKIVVRTWVERNQVCVGVSDTGPGIPPEHRERIFEPFFTTKPAGVGTGLGLDITYRIVAGSYHGQIEFTSEPGNTEFIVRLPISE
ncbi:ATP-binding protein [Paracidobacterium acidisoli]|nr:ATP-binding protein [Paracidobacterium acidisoli]